MEPIKTGSWPSCTVSQFVDNSKVACYINGDVYVISNFSQYCENDFLNAVRIYNTKSQQWSIPTFEQWRNIHILGTNLIFKYNPKSDFGLYAINLQQMAKSNCRKEVPDWAVHHFEKTLSSGKIVSVYWSRQKLEVCDSKGRLFCYDHYQVNRLQHNNANYVHEKGIIVNVYMENDLFIVSTSNKSSLESAWKQFEILTLEERQENNDAAKIEEPEFVPPRKHNREVYSKLFFNVKGEQVFEDAKKFYSEGVSDAAAAALAVAQSKRIGSGHRKEELPNILTNEENNWTAIWNYYHLTVLDNNNNELFHKSMHPAGIEKVFFEGDMVGVIVYNFKQNQEESGNQYCSGPTVYDVDEEWRENYRILYFRNCDTPVKTVVLSNRKEYYDHMGRKSDIKAPRIISVNGDLIAQAMPNGSLTFENLVTNLLLTYSNSLCKVNNNRFLITKDFTCYNLSEGIEKVCSVPKPWTSVELFGSYLAITRPTNEVNIVNLDTGTVEFEEKTEETPKEICGFKYHKASGGFLAIKYEKFIKVWFQDEY